MTSPEEQEEERLAGERRSYRQRTQLERMRLFLAEDRPKRRAAAMSIKAANYMPPEEEGQ